jgi:SAM-dependent methyltransferase
VTAARSRRPAAAAHAGETWRDYWSRDRLWRDSELLRINAALLRRRAPEAFTLGPDDAVLDIGCGPGLLEALLAPQVARVHAVDVAGQFVELCRERCREFGNVTVGALGEDYTDLSGLEGPFTRMLCASVVQYYRDPGEVVALIASARTVAAPGALMLVADLPLARGPAGFAWDAACSLIQAAREGYLGALLRTARGRWSGGSGYRDFAGRVRQLAFTPDGLASLIAGVNDRLGVRAGLVRGSVSVYANRPSLLIRF